MKNAEDAIQTMQTPKRLSSCICRRDHLSTQAGAIKLPTDLPTHWRAYGRSNNNWWKEAGSISSTRRVSRLFMMYLYELAPAYTSSDDCYTQNTFRRTWGCLGATVATDERRQLAEVIRVKRAEDGSRRSENYDIESKRHYIRRKGRWWRPKVLILRQRDTI